MSSNDLAAALVSYAAWETAGLATMLGVLAEFDRRRVWAEWECWSAQQWSSWKCGLGRVAASERLRVAHRLPELPAVRARFEAGELSWSKVREITRVANSDDEATWVRIATHATASQVAALVRQARRITRRQTATQLADRSLGSRVDDDGAMVLSLRLPAEQHAVVMAAVRAQMAHTKGVAWATAAADALVELVLAQAEVRTEVHVHVDPDGAHLEDGSSISNETAEVLACNADQVDVIGTGADGEPVELDRRRGANRQQRRWLAHHHRSCQFPGCHHEGSFEVHHVLEHARTGRSKMRNFARLCGFHHRLIHLHRLQVTLLADRTLTVATEDGVPIDRPLPTLPLPVDEPVDPGRLGQWFGDHLDIGMCLDALGYRAAFPAGNRTAAPHPGVSIPGSPGPSSRGGAATVCTVAADSDVTWELSDDHVGVITGTDPAFCSGDDVRYVMGGGESSKTRLAAVNGAAVGWGMDHDELMPAPRASAGRIAANAPSAVAQLEAGQRTALDPDHCEGVRSFLEKRPPQFTGH